MTPEALIRAWNKIKAGVPAGPGADAVRANLFDAWVGFKHSELAAK